MEEEQTKIESLLPFKYVKFSTPEEGKIPHKKELTYNVTGYAAILIRAILDNSGFKKTTSLQNALVIVGSNLPEGKARTLTINQRMNHYLFTFSIGSKDGYHKVMTALEKRIGHRVSFYPESYYLPSQKAALAKAFPTAPLWIQKPAGGSRGIGIHVINELPKKGTAHLIIQRYIPNPMLINGLKFDLRFYVAVTNLDPLTVYVFDNGLVRLATAKYEDNLDNIDNVAAHLTNFSINKDKEGFVATNDLSKDGTGNKWSHHPFWPYLESQGINSEEIRSKIYDAFATVIVAAHRSFKAQTNHQVSFELFGFDVMLDQDLNVYILEVNVSPAMGTSSELDRAIKTPLVKDLFILAGIPSPSPEYDAFCRVRYGKADERAKEYAVLAEFEMAQSRIGHFRRIFPTAKNVGSIGSMMECPSKADKILHEYVKLDEDKQKKFLADRREAFEAACK